MNNIKYSSIEEIKQGLKEQINTHHQSQLDKIKDCLQELLEDVESQQKKIEDYNGKQVFLIRFVKSSTSNSEVIVEKGNLLDYEINGYLAQSELVDRKECSRQGTKKYQKIVDDFQKQYNGIIQ